MKLKGTIIKSFLCSIITCVLISFIVPFNVFADVTYTTWNGLTCYNAFRYSTNYYEHTYFSNTGGQGVRVVGLRNTSQNQFYYFYVNNTTAFKYNLSQNTNSACTLTTTPNTAGNRTYNGNTYYYVQSYVMLERLNETFNNVPIIDLSGTLSSTQYADYAYRYTFGDLADDTEPYGDLKDLGFQTYFTNTQQNSLLASRNNKDVITWDGYEDTNGNQINTLNMFVDIQAYQTEYSANTKSDLLNLTINSYTTIGDPVTLVSMGANSGRYEITWGEVATALVGTNMLSEFFNNFMPHYYEGLYYTNGWLYRIRLRTHDNSYVGDWKIIYQITSAPPSDSSTIMQYYYQDYQYGYDNRVINTIENMNTYNNTNNQYFINELPIDTNQNSNGSSWWDALLRLLEKIIDGIFGLLNTLINELLDLISTLGVNVIQAFTDLFDSITDLLGNIDLTSIHFAIPQQYFTDLQYFKQLTLEFFNIYFDNGLGWLVMIPFILLLISLVF